MLTNDEQHDKYKIFLDTTFTMPTDQHHILRKHINTLMGGSGDIDAIEKQGVSILCSSPNFAQEYYGSNYEVRRRMLTLISTSIQVGYLMHKTELEGKL